MTNVFVDDVVDAVLNGLTFERLLTCPLCKATIDPKCQDLESDSDIYLCANCGFTVPRK